MIYYSSYLHFIIWQRLHFALRTALNLHGMDSRRWKFEILVHVDRIVSRDFSDLLSEPPVLPHREWVLLDSEPVSEEASVVRLMFMFVEPVCDDHVGCFLDE